MSWLGFLFPTWFSLSTFGTLCLWARKASSDISRLELECWSNANIRLSPDIAGWIFVGHFELYKSLETCLSPSQICSNWYYCFTLWYRSLPLHDFAVTVVMFSPHVSHCVQRKLVETRLSPRMVLARLKLRDMFDGPRSWIRCTIAVSRRSLNSRT